MHAVSSVSAAVFCALGLVARVHIRAKSRWCNFVQLKFTVLLHLIYSKFYCTRTVQYFLPILVSIFIREFEFLSIIASSLIKWNCRNRTRRARGVAEAEMIQKQSREGSRDESRTRESRQRRNAERRQRRNASRKRDAKRERKHEQ